jgi:hypothetical protein
MVSLKLEIAQEPPFSSPEEEALLNLVRTADWLNRAFHRNTRDWGVTSTQYNVLRILRGAQPHGLTCSDHRRAGYHPAAGAAEGAEVCAPAPRSA